MRVLALVPHPPRVASVRFRITQLREPLARQGIELVAAPFLEPGEMEAVYGEGGPISAGLATLRALRRRWRILGELDAWDAVLVHREVAPLLNGTFTRRLARRGTPFLFDFDDAVYLPAVGGRRALRLLRRPRAETARLCRQAALCLAGNAHLADFARSAGGRPVLLPTVVDTDHYRPAADEPGEGDGETVISWVGSRTTEPYLEAVADALEPVVRETGAVVEVVSSQAPERVGGLEVRGVRWKLPDEPGYFRRADVGIYPLPDDAWARGKCGLKALLYLASGVPVVASPVGVLPRMVRDGETGFLVTTRQEWTEALGTLVADPELRREMGRRGRRLVEERFSLERGAETLEEALRRTVPGTGA